MRDIIDHIPHKPSYCVWELTFKCNLKCLHCASRLNEGRDRGEELSLPETLRVCDELYDLGCSTVVLSGGEALLHKNWERIAQKLVGLGIRVELISNGLIINKAIADRIGNAGVSRVALSLDGLEPTHNYIRSNESSFSSVFRAAQYIKEIGIPINAVTHVNRLNISELNELEDLISSARFDVWRVQMGAPLGRMQDNRELVIRPAELPAVADFIVAAKKRGRIHITVGDNIGYFSHHEQYLRNAPGLKGLNFWCGCFAGCLSIGIESNGNIKGCLSLQSDVFVEGNVRDEPLKAIWERKGAFSYNRDFMIEWLHGNCRDCEYGEICRGGCTFMAFSATGDPHDNPYCLHSVLRAQ